MENKIKRIDWEKISVYFTALAILITIMVFLNQFQRDIMDIVERIAVLETKTEERNGK